MSQNVQTIRERAFTFACDAVRVALRIQPLPGSRCVVDQLVKASTSIGANLEEAKAGSSRREFLRYVEISLREARETHYWLRLCLAVKLAPAEALQPLVGEADQLVRILTVIVLNTKRKMRSHPVAHTVIVSAFCILNSQFLIS